MLRLLFALLVSLTLVACSHTSRPATYLVEQTGPYRLDSGDLVRVTVYGDANLTNSYRVDDAGAIALPLVGAIPARGATTEVVGGRITTALANGFMRNPNVAVEVAEYRPFFIQGAVGSPGALSYVYGMTVRAAISAAGGFTDVANRNSAVIYRRQGDDMVRGSVGLDFPILPGDTIVVSERWL
ncbi:polysaccharide biosynthesis/export family protein [Pelagibacterium xiamenense]|uniref:polysaccharide biosynthesis/export family protein n=1 Tax=Pelagibacterium xiamenense TaxID=2901140 RepID=UPI001E4135A7|nr:polysaccharide biosynthesis/export family protein [Pelagibacterium xiamenense]MCD7060811.1 polysaccharide export protein [Pelagibacterium xiamenense]